MVQELPQDGKLMTVRVVLSTLTTLEEQKVEIEKVPIFYHHVLYAIWISYLRVKYMTT